MRQFGIPCNTLRDYICKLKTVDAERYQRVVEAEQEKMGKILVKCIQLSCRAVLNEYRDQANKLKQQKKLLPFYPKEGFYTQKYIGKHFLTNETYSVINNLAAVWFKICVNCIFDDNRVIYIKT